MNFSSIVTGMRNPANLHELVADVTGSSILQAVARNNFIVNEVSNEILVATDRNALIEVLNSLIDTVVRHTRDSCIRIKAREYDDIMFIYIKDKSGFTNYSDTDMLAHAKQLAKQLNGNIIVRNLEDRFTNILLSFPNFATS